MEGLSSIKWGAYREGARFQLPRFDSLNPEGPALLEAYQDVLDKDETFTQYFCDERLQSYELESNLRQLLGIRPPLVDEPESSNNQNDVSISWINIFRHGKFEKTDDDFYQCRMQGRLVKIDETMHKAILVNRCFLPPNTNPWVSAADVTKECEVNVSIEGDILNELHRQMKYVERLKRLQQSLKKRRYRLRRDQGPEASSYKSSDTPQSFRSNYPSPTDSSQKLSVLSRTAIDSQHKSRVSTSVEPSVDLMNPTVSVEYPDEQGRSASPSSSDASTGVDIPFSRNQNNRKRKSMSSDLEQTVDEGWSSQNQTPLPHDTSTPFISASKKTKLAASEENTTMVNGVDAAAKSRTPVPSNKSAWLASVPKEYQPAAANSHTMNGNGKTVSESRDTMGEGRSAVDKRKGAMDISPAETPKPMTPTQRAKQPAPNHATPPKSKRALNGVASSLRQEYENAGQPIDITSSRASTPGLSQEAMRLGSEMAGWQEGFTPVQPRPKLATTKTKTKPKTKEPKKGVRVRNNFTQEEFDFAPAWLKPRFEAGISPAQLEQEYEARFGVLHRHNTLKLWLDRQEAKSGVVPTKIVPTTELPHDRPVSQTPVSSFRPINPSSYVSPYSHLSSQASPQAENMPSAPPPTSMPTQKFSLTKIMPSSIAHSTLLPAQSFLLTENISQSAERPTPLPTQNPSSTEIMPSSAAITNNLPAQSSSLTTNTPRSPRRPTSTPAQRSSYTENRSTSFSRSTPMPNGLPKPE